jgi:hypothetical protein
VGIGRWWRAGHHIGASALKAAVLEPGADGRWYEIDEGEYQADWGRVLAWQINADLRFDSDLVTEIEVRFIANGAGATRVEFEHRWPRTRRPCASC